MLRRRCCRCTLQIALACCRPSHSASASSHAAKAVAHSELWLVHLHFSVLMTVLPSLLLAGGGRAGPDTLRKDRLRPSLRPSIIMLETCWALAEGKEAASGTARPHGRRAAPRFALDRASWQRAKNASLFSADGIDPHLIMTVNSHIVLPRICMKYQNI